MKTRLLTSLLAVWGMGWPTASVHAAPLDAFLDASPAVMAGHSFVELTADRMNDALDIFKLRSESYSLETGDHKGWTLRAGRQLSPQWWMDGALQRHTLTYGADQPQVESWRVGLQWSLGDQQGARPASALRLSAFGNHAQALKKSSPSQLGQFVVDSLQVNKPRDHTVQADAIGTWAWGPYRATGFVGAGRGQMRVDSVRATLGGLSATYSNGSFNHSLLNQLTEQSQLGDELRAIHDDLRMAQVGLNLAYIQGPWSWRGGYVAQHITRPAIDAVVQNKGKTSYNINHTLLGEVAYAVTPHVRLLLRGQAMSNQFLTEMPILYNSLTSHRFKERYGLVYAGVGIRF